MKRFVKGPLINMWSSLQKIVFTYFDRVIRKCPFHLLAWNKLLSQRILENDFDT